MEMMFDREALANVRISEIPAYLRKSNFFRNLDVDNDDSFTILLAYYKPDLIVHNLRDFEWLLETIRYWGVDDILPLLLEHPKASVASCCSAELLRAYEIEMPYLRDLPQLAPFQHNPSRLMDVAMKCGQLEVVEFVRRVYSVQWSHSHMENAARYGRVDSLKYALNHGCTILHMNLFQTAVAHGHLECVRFLHEMHCPARYDICSTAVRNHQTHILKYLIGAFYIAHDAIRAAIDVDNEEALHFLHISARYTLPADASMRTTLHDSLSCLKYLHKHNFPHTKQLYYSAVLRCSAKCLRYLRDTGCPRSVEECITATVKQRKWKCLEFLFEYEPPDGANFHVHPSFRAPELMDIVLSGNVKLLQKLILVHCHISAKVVRTLVARNDYTTLALGLQHNCVAKTAEICTTAACLGHLECLQVAHEAGCPWSTEVCALAIENGHLDCLQYAHEHGCPWQVAATVRTPYLDCLQYAEQHGCLIGRRGKK